MKKFIFVLVWLFAVSTAMASYGLRYYSFQIVDESGDAITSGLKYTVETINTGTAATIYNRQNFISTGTRAAGTITNSATRLSTSTPYGFLSFYYAPSTYDLKIENDVGVYLRFEDVTALDHVFVWPNVLSGYVDLHITGTLDIDEEVDVDFDAQDEEFNITTSSGRTAGESVFTIANSDTDVTDQHYLLELEHADDGDVDADFFVCTDSAGTNVKFKIEQDGDTSIAGTLGVADIATFDVQSVHTLGLDVNDSVDIDLSVDSDDVHIQLAVEKAAADEAVVTIRCSDTDVDTQMWLLELAYVDDGDADADFFVCKDSDATSGTTKFSITEEGNMTTLGTITAGTGANALTNAVGLIDGEKIQDDTIDDDAIDFDDVTGLDLDLTDCVDVDATYGVTGATGVFTSSVTVDCLTVDTVLSFPSQSVAGADLVNDSVTDTQLEYNTGQNLTTTSDVAFSTLNITGTGTALDVDGDVNVDGTLLVDGILSVGTGPRILTDATGDIDGEYIQANTIDTDSIDWGASTGQIGFHSLGTVTIVTDSTTIATTDMGKIYICTKVTEASFTLPYSSNTIDNGCVMIKNTGGANVYSVIPSGNDQIDVAGAGTAYDGIDDDNDFVVLYNDKGSAGSAGNWYILGKNGGQ